MAREIVFERNATPDVGTTNHIANDVLGGLLTFDVSALPSGAIINSAYVQDSKNTGAALRIHLFKSEPAQSFADNDAWLPNAVTQRARFAFKDILSTDYVTENSLKAAYIEDFNQVMPGALTNLYVYVENVDAYNPDAATNFYIAFTFLGNIGGRNDHVISLVSGS